MRAADLCSTLKGELDFQKKHTYPGEREIILAELKKYIFLFEWFFDKYTMALNDGGRIKL